MRKKNEKKAIAPYPPLLLFYQELKLCTVERIGSNITSVFKAIALYIYILLLR